MSINILGKESSTVTPISHSYSGGNIVAGVQFGRSGEKLSTSKGDIPVFGSIKDILDAGIVFDFELSLHESKTSCQVSVTFAKERISASPGVFSPEWSRTAGSPPSSEENTDKINDTIESMNSEIDMVRTDWLKLLSGQDAERHQIDRLVHDVEIITNMIIDLLDRFTGLKSINDQNLEGMNQVLIGISEIQKAVELSARNAMESRKASELIIETISHIGESVEELAVMADELQQG
jgi:hypothetical protein